MTTSPQDLFAGFSTLKEQVDNYNTQRQQLVDNLKQMVQQAQELLTQLGEGAIAAPTRARGRRGRPPGLKNKSAGAGKTGKAKKTGKRGRRKGSKLSDEARARIAAAQKARWAKIRREKDQ